RPRSGVSPHSRATLPRTRCISFRPGTKRHRSQSPEKPPPRPWGIVAADQLPPGWAGGRQKRLRRGRLLRLQTPQKVLVEEKQVDPVGGQECFQGHVALPRIEEVVAEPLPLRLADVEANLTGPVSLKQAGPFTSDQRLEGEHALDGGADGHP